MGIYMELVVIMMKEIKKKLLKVCLLALLLLPIACSSDENGLGEVGAVLSCPSSLPTGYFCDTNGLQAKTAGYCTPANSGSDKTNDCALPFDACSSKHQCIVSTSDKYWFATDFIRPAVTSDCNSATGCTNFQGYIYNIMAKGYDSLDDWCASQAHLSNDKNVHNRFKWRALIVANGDGNNGRPNTLNTDCILSQIGCSYFDRLSDAFLNSGSLVFQESPNAYLIPNRTSNGNTCTNGLCGKFGEDIAKNIGGIEYTTAWYGYDVGCRWVQIGFVAGIGSCNSQVNCLERLDFKNLQEWVAGSLPGQRTLAYWSDSSGNSSGSIYMSSGEYSAAGCGVLGPNGGSVAKRQGSFKDSFDTGDTFQNRVICLSD